MSFIDVLGCSGRAELVVQMMNRIFSNPPLTWHHNVRSINSPPLSAAAGRARRQISSPSQPIRDEYCATAAEEVRARCLQTETDLLVCRDSQSRAECGDGN